MRASILSPRGHSHWKVVWVCTALNLRPPFSDHDFSAHHHNYIYQALLWLQRPHLFLKISAFLRSIFSNFSYDFSPWNPSFENLLVPKTQFQAKKSVLEILGALNPRPTKPFFCNMVYQGGGGWLPPPLWTWNWRAQSMIVWYHGIG